MKNIKASRVIRNIERLCRESSYLKSSGYLQKNTKTSCYSLSKSKRINLPRPCGFSRCEKQLD